MDTVTYPQDEVAAFFREHLLPVRKAHDAEELGPLFAVVWTPTLILLDALGREHHRTVGFLDPDELVASLLLGMGKLRLAGDGFEECRQFLGRLLDEYPRSEFAPEAVYYSGINLFRQTYDPGELGAMYQRLQREYPASGWCNRASPYSIL